MTGGITRYTDQELECMLVDIESDLVERKESFRGEAPTSVREAVCAFANDLPNHERAGVVFIGAKDDGTPAGLVVSDELLRNVGDVKTDGNITPPPTVTLAKRKLLDNDMVVLVVEPADAPPVRYRGTTYIRIGPRRGIATAQDERILNEKRRHRDLPFDAQSLPGATLCDLNRDYFQSVYLPAALRSDQIPAGLEYEQLLASTKMVESVNDPTPTVLGLLVLGIRTLDFLPGAHVHFVRVDGETVADPISSDSIIDGAIAEMLTRLEQTLVEHNSLSERSSGRPVVPSAEAYPLEALRHLAWNAVLHRTYEGTNMPIRVYWYNDRIEIMNPGGPFGAVSPESFGQPGVTDYRNPNLCRALTALGLVRRCGTGIAAARAALAANGNPPPQFLLETTYTGVIVRSAR